MMGRVSALVGHAPGQGQSGSHCPPSLPLVVRGAVVGGAASGACLAGSPSGLLMVAPRAWLGRITLT